MTKREIIESLIIKATTLQEIVFRDEIIDWLEFQTDIDKWGRLIFKPISAREDPFEDQSGQLELHPPLDLDDIRKAYGE